MLDFIKMFVDWVKDRSPAGLARITAFLVVPGGILVLVTSGIFGDSLRWDLAKPLTISRLRTELSANGHAISKPGVALIFEPATDERQYNFVFKSSPKHLWTSLEEETARANREHLRADDSGMASKTPFFGINDPVIVVVEGEMDDKIFLPATTTKIDDWQLPSRRSESIVASVLLSCAVAFGISVARGFPSADRTQASAG